jgi:hypothetical protein
VRLDHLLSKERHWPHARIGSVFGLGRGGWGPGRLTLQTNALRVGQLISGALAIRVVWLVSGCEYCPPSAVGSGKSSQGAAGARSHCWVLRERAPGFLVSVVFRPFRACFAWLVGWVRACGPVRPPYRIVFLAAGDVCVSVVGGGVFGGGVGWCPFVF